MLREPEKAREQEITEKKIVGITAKGATTKINFFIVVAWAISAKLRVAFFARVNQWRSDNEQ
jgi:hypothetical protein